MQWLRTAARETFGLFVDDVSYAIAILVWVALAWLLLPRLAGPSAWGGPILFVGLALILLGSALHRARQ